MTLKECYAELGGDYNDAMSRLYDENFIKMFVLKFRNDKNYENLKKYLEDLNVKNVVEILLQKIFLLWKKK